MTEGIPVQIGLVSLHLIVHVLEGLLTEVPMVALLQHVDVCICHQGERLEV